MIARIKKACPRVKLIASPMKPKNIETNSAMGIGNAPLATGRYFLNGCLRSLGASKTSLKI